MYSGNFEISDHRKQIFLKSFLIIITGYILVTYAVSLVAFVSPSENMRWNSDVDTIVPATYNRGDTVSITGLLEEGTEYLKYGPYYYLSFSSTEDITWAVIVLSPSNVPFSIQTGSLSGITGDFAITPVSVNIPSNAELGTYTVRVIIWTDLLPTGETKTNLINEGSFEVVI